MIPNCLNVGIVFTYGIQLRGQVVRGQAGVYILTGKVGC